MRIFALYILVGSFVLLRADSLFAEESPAFSYGEAYEADSSVRELPRFSLDVSFASDISNSFVDIRSFVGNGQYRLWKYISTGILGQYSSSRLSSAGKQIRGLEAVDIQTSIPTMHWAVFSHTQLQILLGRWNMWNAFDLEVELLAGGGMGFVGRKQDINGNTKSKLSYLWTVDQRTRISKNLGLSLGAFGHRSGTFLRAGMHAGFNF